MTSTALSISFRGSNFNLADIMRIVRCDYTTALPSASTALSVTVVAVASVMTVVAVVMVIVIVAVRVRT